MRKLDISAYKECSEEWWCPYDGHLVRVGLCSAMTNFVVDGKYGDLEPSFLVYVTDEDDMVCNKGFREEEEARKVFMALLAAEEITLAVVSLVGLEF